MSLGDKASELYRSGKGYNCAQCILCTCTELETYTALSVSKGFGSGMKCGEVCGCITGAYMALGYRDTAVGNYKRLLNAFKDKFGYIKCTDLKANHIPCLDLIKFTADTVEEIIGE